MDTKIKEHQLYERDNDFKDLVFTRSKMELNGYGEQVDELLIILKYNYPNLDFSILEHNISSLKITNLKNLSHIRRFLEYKICGLEANYEPTLNEIFLKTPTMETLFHELLHAFTSLEYSDREIVGFYQHNNVTNSDIGICLNEGYTELLTSRFCPYFKEFDHYVLELLIAELIERIVGKDKMLELYFKADLKSLVEELSKYDDEASIITLLEALDEIYEVGETLSFPFYTVNIEFLDLVNKVLDILLIYYTQKLISQNKTDEEINTYCSSVRNEFNNLMANYHLKEELPLVKIKSIITSTARGKK